MSDIIFVFSTENVTFWEFESIRQLTENLKPNWTISALIKEEYSHNKKESWFFRLLRNYSKKKYSFSKNAFEKIYIKKFEKINIIKELPITFNGVIVNFSNNEFKNANCKVWEFRYGKNQERDYQLLGFSEIFKKGDIIQSSLIEIAGNEKNKVICTTTSSLHQLAFQRSLNEHFLKQSTFIRRALKKKQSGCLVLKPIEEVRELSGPISGYQIGLAFLNIILKSIASGIFRNNKIKWTLRYSLEGSKKLSEYSILESPANYFWADPFIRKFKSTFQLFIEEKNLSKGNGFISVIDFKNENDFTASKIIEEKYHLSYPFLFDFKNELYIIPESSMNSTINLYRCVNYPAKWEFVKYIMEDLKAVDSTLFHYNNKWWMFSNINEVEGASIQDELFLFFCDDPTANSWKPHPQNPIVSDVRRSRPAGNIFIEEGKIIRPSQNSAKRYGYSLNFNQITKITEEEYEEVFVSELKPWSKKIEALHTFNKQDNFIIIDTKE